ncbi:4Fe-4S binding protein [Desulfosudis oleivorans]|uniref:4Fe-4S ferredoxin iron-sulfur binding domain protein n=1 Tax=Desulfosudis oleivorans (strain DSM 6200 / JCM 39069 / Hxd3) TaxID=96561 RepID=A8ZSL4_DESOH|nr:4Fe-4S binding protein [Desulfosudis oleivorans]ABW65927.1 4Fe-4S ferredoxin iron-sulfur binding domain protein [Desulfosudis oleivorans Hxd3]
MATGLSLKERFDIPEYDDMAAMHYALLDFDQEKCVQCGLCVSACAGGCILIGSLYRSDFISGQGKARQGFPELDTLPNQTPMCVGCLTCSAACPTGAITIKQPFRPGGRLKKLHQAPEMTPPHRY